MFILIESRAKVTEAFATQLAREGVSLTGLSGREFQDWLGQTTKSEFNSVDAFLIGECEDRPGSARALKAKGARVVIGLNDLHVLDVTLDLFASGVDDVVRKPVHAREILARAHAIRSRGESNNGSVTIGSLRVHFDGRDPEIAGATLALPRRERRILECLAANRGKRLTKSQIFQSIYGIFDEDVEESVIESHVSKLRKKLRAKIGVDVIDSKRYIGYCMLAPNAAAPESGADRRMSRLPQVSMARPGLEAVAAL
jgi:DNA-binding response OmpR family regulator